MGCPPTSGSKPSASASPPDNPRSVAEIPVEPRWRGKGDQRWRPRRDVKPSRSSNPLMASSQADPAASLPALVATRTARSVAGAIQIAQNQDVLLPRCVQDLATGPRILANQPAPGVLLTGRWASGGP